MEESRHLYPNVNAVGERDCREWPIAMEVRLGRYRHVVCLMARGARLDVTSYLDNKSLMDLAVESGCAMTVYELVKAKGRVTLNHLLASARAKNLSLMGVLLAQTSRYSAN